MLFVEFEGKDYFNMHFSNIQTCAEYVKNTVESDFFDVSYIHVYELQEEPDNSVFKMEVFFVNVERFRKMRKETHG